MKFFLMGLVKQFTKEAGRSPNPTELANLKKLALEMESSEKIIPFPKDRITNPFEPRPEPKNKKSIDLAKELEELTNKNLEERGLGSIKLGDELPPPKNKKPDVDPELQAMDDQNTMFKDFENRTETDAEIIARMNKQNKDSVKRLKEKKEKDLGDKLKDFDGDPDAMAEGGIARIGFKEGGGMTRRTFLKLLGGLASIPLVGKFLKPAAKVAKTAEIAKQSGVPAYFPKLVEKIKLLGDDVTETAATVERQKVIDYKDYTLTEDLPTGAITIDKKTEGGGMYRIGDEMEYESGIVKQERIEYTPPETIMGKDGKPVKVPAQYEEITVKPDFEGKMKDVESGLDSYDEILKEVGESKIKKSGGGLAYMMGE